MENLGIQIRRVREDINLSQDRFGRRLGLSGKAISAYETGKARPPLRVLEKISDVYEVSLYDIPKCKQHNIEEKINELFKAVHELRNALSEGLTL